MRAIIDQAQCMRDHKFDHITVIWREDESLYLTPDNRTVTLADLDPSASNCKPIPPNHVHGTWRKGFMEIPTESISDSFYVKTPSLLQYDGTDYITEIVTAEVEIMEVLAKNPHPNICEYAGCRRDGSFITGICLKRYEQTLQDFLESVPLDQLVFST